MPLDIFVPYWGDPALLRETVASVLAQRNGDWLLTVVDDAYPDESVPAWFATIDDPRVTYVRKERNEGITANYRTCVSMATQDAVVILGCDDVLLPDFVDVVLAARTRFPQAAVVQPGVEVIDEHGRVVRPLADRVKQDVVRPRARTARVLGGEALAANLMHGDWLYWPSLVFRRDVLVRTPFLDDLPLIQDLALVMDMVLDGEQLVLEPTVCFRYRRHSASASSASLIDGRRFAGERTYFAHVAQRCDAQGWHRAARAARLAATSRLHALTLLPRAARTGGGAVRTMLRHAFGPMRP
ncbi:glycosyltransferase [Cellulomonas hominis]|uniref:glycosyltransferase family 2 protein n=1 Tax=Cellulomonas hominis TaxID=156981 RepID=UPI001C11A3DD|nr:glycosyltransferase [Cellulomonas hominis]MBU5424045.1 glycosyltransferase [Cellulomonas hominis]